MERSDHDLLISISVGQQELKTDMRGLADDIKDIKVGQAMMGQRQNDLEGRLTSITNTMQRVLTDQRTDHDALTTLTSETSRWKIYMKVALVLLTPVYLIVLALIVEAAKNLLMP